MNQFSRNLALWLVLGLMFLLLFQIFNKQQAQEPERDYSEFSEALDKGDPTVKVPFRDRIVAIKAPFTGQPAEWFKTEWRAAGVTFSAGDAYNAAPLIATTSARIVNTGSITSIAINANGSTISATSDFA